MQSAAMTFDYNHDFFHKCNNYAINAHNSFYLERNSK